MHQQGEWKKMTNKIEDEIKRKMSDMKYLIDTGKKEGYKKGRQETIADELKFLEELYDYDLDEESQVEFFLNKLEKRINELKQKLQEMKHGSLLEKED